MKNNVLSAKILDEKISSILDKNSVDDSTNKNSMITISMDQLKNSGSSEIYNKINELQVLIENVSPYRNKSVFGKGAVPQIIYKFFKINKVSKYLEKFESTSKLIDNIMLYLNRSKQELSNDNKALKLEIESLAIKRAELKNIIDEIEKIQLECEAYIEANKSDDLEIKRFKNETYFPMLQKLTDTKQRVLVMEQSIIAFTTLIANNNELITSLDRSSCVTVEALGAAILMAQSLSEQERILNSVSGLNKVTADLIKHTASQLKTQGVNIQMQASSAMIDMESLEVAFKDCLEAFQKIKDFRVNAVTTIKNQLNKFEKLTDEINKNNALTKQIINTKDTSKN